MKVYAIVEGAYYDSEVKYIVTDKALAEKLEKEVFEKDLIATHIEEHDTDEYKKENLKNENSKEVCNMRYRELNKWEIDEAINRENKVLMTDLFSESVHDIEELTYIEVKEAIEDASGRYVFFEVYEEMEAEQ